MYNWTVVYNPLAKHLHCHTHLEFVSAIKGLHLIDLEGKKAVASKGHGMVSSFTFVFLCRPEFRLELRKAVVVAATSC